MATVSMRRMTLSALAVFALGAACPWGADGTARAGTPKEAPTPPPVYAVVQGKSLAVQSAPLGFAPFADVKDVHLYWATEQGTGAPYMIVSGNVICHSPYPNSVITIEVSPFLTHSTGVFAMGTFSTAIERIAPGRAVPFSILCTPTVLWPDLECRFKWGWKAMYTISLHAAVWAPK